MFIVIEGLDGAGKSTQIKLIEEYLCHQNLNSRFLHFPRFESPVYGELIARFLRGEFGDTNEVDPSLVALLYAGDRHNAAGLINDWLNNRYIVLVDRYVYSNIAYQCAKLPDNERKQKLRRWILDMEYSYFAIPKPDLNIFLDVPFSFTEKKLNGVREGDDRSYLQGKKDIHEADFDLQRRVRTIYLEQESMDESFQLISCVDNNAEMLPPERIFEEIKQKISRFLI
ncbi:MAG: dTMP kinase [Prevotellaceae bacterium]|jgi:dTMP kinase|nr:dTMP kinase [Prevotellaceae bacterium]